jgi:acetoin utilization protein AcuC
VLAILTLLDHGVAPVVYVDLDAHHGDGVEAAFHDFDDVLTISVHEDGRWPGSGLFGDRAGGNARNLPVPQEFNDCELDYIVHNALVPLVQTRQPAALVLQTGVDALNDDPQSKLGLSNRAIWRAVRTLMPLAPRRLVVGGGGYNPWAVARAWAGIWGVLNNFDPGVAHDGEAMTTPLPAAAEDVLRALQWNHSRGRNPPEHWFKYLADSPHLGPVRDPVKAVVEDVLR